MNENKTKKFKLFLIVIGLIAAVTMVIVSINPNLKAKVGLYDNSRAVFYLANALMGVVELIDIVNLKKEKITQDIIEIKLNSIDLLFILGVICQILFFLTSVVTCYIKTVNFYALAFTFLLAMTVSYVICWIKMKKAYIEEE